MIDHKANLRNQCGQPPAREVVLRRELLQRETPPDGTFALVLPPTIEGFHIPSKKIGDSSP